MIKYNLICDNGHEFESWFADSIEFEKLKKRKLLGCIFCNSTKISKSIMSPMISIINDKNEKDYQSNFDTLQKQKNKLINLRNFIEKNFEYVGKDFSKKVREIYYDKKTKKTIYGTTTPEEREELKEEGIDLFSVPWVNKDN